MKTTFAEIVEGIKPPSIQEKQELLDLIRNYLNEERRQEIYESVQESAGELQAGTLEFSGDIERLRGMLSNV